MFFYCALESPADDGVVVYNGVGGAAVVEYGLVEVLDVLRGELPKLNGGGREVGYFMQICCVIYVICVIMASYECVVSGSGAAGWGFIGGILDGVVFRVCFSFLFAYVLGMGITGFFMGEALARLGPIMVGCIYYHSGAWKRYKRLVDR